MRCFQRSLAILCILLGGVLARPAAAQEGFNVQLFRPSPYFGRTIFLYSPSPGSIFTSNNDFSGQWRAGLIVNYQTTSFVSKNGTNFAGQSARDTDILSANALVSFDFTDWLSLGVDVPFHPLGFDYQPDANLGYAVLPDRETFVMGDINVTANIGLLSQSDHGVNVALVGIIIFPTGESENFLGDENVQGGATAVVSRSFGRLLATVNVGYESKKDMQFFNIALDDQISYGGGLAFDLFKDELVLMAEMRGLTTVTDPYDTTENSPLEAIGAARYFWSNGLAATAGFGFGVVDGYGMSDVRIFGGLHYSPPTTEKAAAAAPAPAEPAMPEVPFLAKVPASALAVLKRSYLQPKFGFDSSAVRQEDAAKLDDVATVLIENEEVTPISIEGHTCSMGPEDYNQGLSERRASSVKTYLEGKGVASSRMQTQGFGERRPIETNETREGRRKNRRVEIVLPDGTNIKISND